MDSRVLTLAATFAENIAKADESCNNFGGIWPVLFCFVYRLLFHSWVGLVLFAVVLVVAVGFLLRFGWDAAGGVSKRPK